MPYPFLPEFSRGLGVPLEALVLLMAERAAMSILAPLVGGLSDRFGRRTIMYISLAGFSLMMFGVSIFPIFVIFIIAMLLEGLFKFLFDATTYAYNWRPGAVRAQRACHRHYRNRLVWCFSYRNATDRLVDGAPLGGCLAGTLSVTGCCRADRCCCSLVLTPARPAPKARNQKSRYEPAGHPS